MEKIENNKKIAMITGATGGLGYAFIQELIQESIDEIWAFGRNKERLEALVHKFGNKIVPICKDLTNMDNLISIAKLLEEQKPQIQFLINNAGIAQMKASKDLTTSEIESMIDLNCKAPVILINYCLPYMTSGSKILNICSASAFQPVPYINLYASTKAFERSYSRALHMELKPLGISVTAVCPSWIDTELLTKEINGKKVRFPGIVSPKRVAEQAIKDAKKGKDMSVCSFYVKCQHLNVKLMPQKWTMKIWMRSIKQYL